MEDLPGSVLYAKQVNNDIEREDGIHPRVTSAHYESGKTS